MLGVFLLNQNLKHKLQTAQNKCMCLCLDLPPHSHIGAIHLRKINWLPVSERVESCIVRLFFKYYNGIVPSYINDMFKPSSNKYNTGSQMALDISQQKINTGEKALIFLERKYGLK